MLLDAPDRSPIAWHGGAINSLCVRAAVIAAPGGGGSSGQWRRVASETNRRIDEAMSMTSRYHGAGSES
jgi:hypothetical protein